MKMLSLQTIPNQVKMCIYPYMKSEHIFALSVLPLSKIFRDLLLQRSRTKLTPGFVAFLFSAHSITISLINVFHELKYLVCVSSPLISLIGK